MPVPDPNVPHWLVVIGASLLYFLALAGVIVPAVVALWIKLVDVPHLRASNHAIVNSLAATYGQAQMNARKTDQVQSTVTQLANRGAPVDAPNTPDIR